MLLFSSLLSVILRLIISVYAVLKHLLRQNNDGSHVQLRVHPC